MDPSHTGEAAEKRRSVMKQRRQEELAWDAAHPDIKVYEAEFAKEILPGLRGLSLTRIAAATGLSQQYCSLIRRGLKVPHARHWTSFRVFVAANEEQKLPLRKGTERSRREA